jgi:CO/xanthine dehydrogenase Mo-binding subunit
MTATLGEDAQRIDGRDKVSGKPIYGADRILRKMVHAVPVEATVRKGSIAEIDKSGAQHTPGVLLILTHENFDRLRPIQFSFAGERRSRVSSPSNRQRSNTGDRPLPSWSRRRWKQLRKPLR